MQGGQIARPMNLTRIPPAVSHERDARAYLRKCDRLSATGPIGDDSDAPAAALLGAP